jgi:hypothetical protein
MCAPFCRSSLLASCLARQCCLLALADGRTESSCSPLPACDACNDAAPQQGIAMVPGTSFERSLSQMSPATGAAGYTGESQLSLAYMWAWPHLSLTSAHRS